MTQEQLAFFKKLLEEKKNQLSKNIDETLSEIKELSKCGSNEIFDKASISTDASNDAMIGEKLAQELSKVDYAIEKLQNDTYGICEMCEEDIDLERLKVKPHARYCIVCREIVDKTKKY